MIDVGGGFNPNSIPPIQREWRGNSMSSNSPGMMGGMMNSMNSGSMNSGMNTMPGNSAFGQSRGNKTRRGGTGGMVDPSFRRMMNMKAGQGSSALQGYKPQTPSSGMFPGVSPSIFGQHFDSSGQARQNQMVQGPSNTQGMPNTQGMMGGNPMMQMMQMLPFFQMYSQLSQNQGSPTGQRFY